MPKTISFHTQFLLFEGKSVFDVKSLCFSRVLISHKSCCYMVCSNNNKNIGKANYLFILLLPHKTTFYFTFFLLYSQKLVIFNHHLFRMHIIDCKMYFPLRSLEDGFFLYLSLSPPNSSIFHPHLFLEISVVTLEDKCSAIQISYRFISHKHFFHTLFSANSRIFILSARCAGLSTKDIRIYLTRRIGLPQQPELRDFARLKFI